MFPATKNSGVDSGGDGSFTSAVMHRDLFQAPPKVVKAQGSWVFLSDGRKILDSTGGAAVVSIGHGNEEVKRAVIEQMEKVSYAFSFYYTADSVEALASELVDSTEGKMAKALLVSSGSEAMEAAIKMARQYYLELPTPQQQRDQFIARKQSFHGVTLGALAMGDHRLRRAPFEPILATNFHKVSPCNAYRYKKDGETDAEYVDRLGKELEDKILEIGKDRVAAFVLEPVVGAATGCVPSVPGYFRRMREVCDRYGVLLILDEIMSGVGRCGTLHAWQYEQDFSPDIQTLGKGLNGGYAAVASVLLNNKVLDVFKAGSGAFCHGQTFFNHPVASAAALKVLKIIRTLMPETVPALSKRLESLLFEHTPMPSHPNVGNIRGRGLFWGVEFVEDKSTKQPCPKAWNAASRVAEAAYEMGVMVYPGVGTADGVNGDHILIAPSYLSTDEEVVFLVETMYSAIKQVFEEIRGDKDVKN